MNNLKVTTTAKAIKFIVNETTNNTNGTNSYTKGTRIKNFTSNKITSSPRQMLQGKY